MFDFFSYISLIYNYVCNLIRRLPFFKKKPVSKYNIKLLSSDNVIFNVGDHFIRECELIKDVIGHFDTINDPLPIATFDSKVLKTVVTFLEMFEDEPEYIIPTEIVERPEPDNKKAFKFLKKFRGKELMDLIGAAEYLNSPRLIDYLAFCVLEKMKGKTVAELEYFFDLNDPSEVKVNGKSYSSKVKDV